MTARLKNTIGLWLCLLLAIFGAVQPARAQEQSPHGLTPAGDMPFIPDLGGLRNQTFRNHYGQVRHLSEAVVLRRSSIEGGQATIPAGGLYYLSETDDEARPLMGDPFFVLGERSTLLTLKTAKRVMTGISLEKGQKLLIDQAGYRLWFDYVTDHYQKPYAQLALISPAGSWPLEFSVATAFADMDKVKGLSLPEGESPQMRDFFLDKTYRYGASSFTAKAVTEDRVDFERIEYPVLEQAMFSLSRPWVLDIRQEDYRCYGSKRIYAFRRPEGFLVRVTDWSGTKVLGEKLVRPSTPQGYKDGPAEQEAHGLTIPDQDMHIEIMINPEFLKNSDFMPFANDVPHGWRDGVLSFVVYRDLVTVNNGEPWPLDPRYKVGLEANLLTGKLQRLVIENAEPFQLSNDQTTILGPTMHSDFWNRPAFRVVAKDFADKTVHNLYLRDSFFQRTDNMVFSRAKGRKDVDFFVGRAPTLVSILEDTFLNRLADTAYGTVVEGSHFTSYPRVLSEASFQSPDRAAPFEARLKGFERESTQNRRGEKVISAEGLVIRGSYVDYRNGRIVIPPAGLFYTSRNSRNVRALAGESFLFMGQRAYLTSFASTTLVRRNFDLDYWRNQPTGDNNPVFWQDVPLGENNKVLRYSAHTYLDDRVLAAVNLVKYSGNNFGAPLLVAQGLGQAGISGRYTAPAVYADGSTWVIPEYVGENYIRVAEVGTPLLKNFSFTYQKPVRTVLGPGQSASLGRFQLLVTAVDPKQGTVSLSMRDDTGQEVAAKVLGPLNQTLTAVLPQHQDAVHALQLAFGPVMAELDLIAPFTDGQAGLWLYQDVQTVESDKPLRSDPRFTIRPDVCGHCYQLNELLLANGQAIVLDRDHPVYEGPKRADGRSLFRLVVDDFDGEMIHAWHLETTVKGREFKTQNLAFNPRNNLDVLIGVNGTIEGFLRSSMTERLAALEYWRRGQHPPVHGGLAERLALHLQ